MSGAIQEVRTRWLAGWRFTLPLVVGWIATAWSGSTGAAADSVNLSYMQGLEPIAAEQVTAYGTDLFGDQINLFNGALTFEHTDLSLPGNNALPVALICPRRSNFDPPCRLNFDPGLVAEIA